MKAIMISDKPKWCALMMNGDKNIEVRKESVGKAVQKLIDENGYADIYVYCTKDDDLGCIKKISKDKYVCGKDFDIKDFNYLASGYNGKGKVVFKFRCYKVEKIPSCQFSIYYFPYTETLDDYELLSKSCLTKEEIDDYLGYVKYGYAIHISDLEIFDKPKELSEFYKVGYNEALENSLKAKPFPISPYYIQNQYLLRKAPQNFCYVEVE